MVPGHCKVLQACCGLEVLDFSPGVYCFSLEFKVYCFKQGFRHLRNCSWACLYLLLFHRDACMCTNMC